MSEVDFGLFLAVSSLTYKRTWGGINNAILSILQAGLVKMVDQNLQTAQAAAVLNQPQPPPPQNPDEPPANPQNVAAEEVSLDLCLFFFFCLKSVFASQHVLSSSPLLVHFHLVL